jgi:hypothetical protein
MARTVWYVERYEKAAETASWSGEFDDFAKVRDLVKSALESGKEESIRFSAPDKAPASEIQELLALGAWERT